ncbi:uncharacterized protein RSE6_02650 [Rhynchosporium secalis]|uniref:Uncharacterized protein n=1 Tax=Rhynchosporium secalis TaxID=38038 RepID=A0A1E1M0Q9_RHYSE|nr:uncharacterized protein RSE6_02650 [Rhynchosporium secalis]
MTLVPEPAALYVISFLDIGSLDPALMMRQFAISLDHNDPLSLEAGTAIGKHCVYLQLYMGFFKFLSLNLHMHPPEPETEAPMQATLARVALGKQRLLLNAT